MDRPLQPSTAKCNGDLRVRLVVLLAACDLLPRRLGPVPRQSAAHRRNDRQSCKDAPRVVDV